MHFGKSRSSGQFLTRLWIEEGEFDAIAMGLLDRYRFLPAEPGPVNIELLAEQLFGFSYEFEEMPHSDLGYVAFGPDGPTRLAINSRLDNLSDATATHRCRSTLAHECGHGVLHTPLYIALWRERLARGELGPNFQLTESPASVIEKCADPRRTPWWEYQANRLMAALLMPAPLVLQVLGRHWLPGVPYAKWPDRHRYKVIVELGETFDVSRTLARLRVDDLFQKALPAIHTSLKEGRSFASLAQCWPPTLFAHLRKAA